jgi:hypothetical protein
MVAVPNQKPVEVIAHDALALLMAGPPTGAIEHQAPGVRSRTSFRSGSARDAADAYLAQGRERGAGDGRGEKRNRPALHGPGRIARLT